MDFIKREKDLQDARMLSPLVWAYVGDSVYELFVRTKLTNNSNAKPHKLHIESIKYVKAKAQADILKKIFKRNTDQLLLDVGTPVYGKFEHGEIFGETIPVFDKSGETIQFKTPRNTGKKFQNLDGEKSVVYRT